MNFFTALTILFIGLKIADIITWSWWWVFAPMWGSVLLVGLVYGLVGGIVAVVKELEK